MRVGHHLGRLTTLALACTFGARLAGAAPLVDGLATDDRAALASAVTAIEHAAPAPELADTLFAAARACEDRLLDPGRALALYDRILREVPEARVAIAARRRADQLRAEVGAGGEHVREAAELAALIAAADALPFAELERRATALADAPWPGAPEAALLVADVARRIGEPDAARRHYAEVVQRWPGTAWAGTAIRGGAGTALDEHAWSRAEELARSLPAEDPADRVLRDDLLEAAAAGRRADRIHTSAWLALALAIASLAASLAEAVLRGGRRWPSPRPPFELWFLAPVAVVMIAIAFTAHALIAPAVAWISLGGTGLAWLSGTTLDLLRVRGRPVRLRAVAHVGACCVGAVALGYLAIVRGGLADMLAETVRFGPGG